MRRSLALSALLLFAHVIQAQRSSGPAKGTLIVDASARVDASIEVAVATISGMVNGDVIGHERVEVGPGAIVNGNISTPSLCIKPGAVFQGDCRILKDEHREK